MLTDPGFFDDYEENQENVIKADTIWNKTDFRSIKNIDQAQPVLKAVFDKQSRKNNTKYKQHLYLAQQSLLCYCKSDNSQTISGVVSLYKIRVEFSEQRGLQGGVETLTFWIIFKRNLNTLTLITKNRELYLQWKDYLTYRAVKVTFHEDFMIQKQIGKGTYAKVFLASKKSNKTDYAVKVYSKDYVANLNHGRESLCNEIEILRQINSPYIIHLYEVYETKNSIYLVLDLLTGGELLTKLQEKKENMKANEMRRIMLNMLLALEHLHSKNIGHRDIKLENLIFQNQQEDSQIILADLGLATNFDKDPSQICYKRCGTPGYIAPEILSYRPENKDFYNIKCDIFSAGIIFYILLSGKQAFPGSDYKQILVKNKECNINFESKELANISSRAKDLLKKMLHVNPSQRLTATQCLKHEFFNSDQKSDSLVTSQQQRQYNYQQFQKSRKRSSDQQSQTGSLALKDVVSGMNGKVETYQQSINEQNQEIEDSPSNQKGSLFQQSQSSEKDINNIKNESEQEQLGQPGQSVQQGASPTRNQIRSSTQKNKQQNLHKMAIKNSMHKTYIEENKGDINYNPLEDEQVFDEDCQLNQCIQKMQFNLIMKHPPSKCNDNSYFYNKLKK